jgi:hypothetical protein
MGHYKIIKWRPKNPQASSISRKARNLSPSGERKSSDIPPLSKHPAGCGSTKDKKQNKTSYWPVFASQAREWPLLNSYLLLGLFPSLITQSRGGILPEGIKNRFFTGQAFPE